MLQAGLFKANGAGGKGFSSLSILIFLGYGATFKT